MGNHYHLLLETPEPNLAGLVGHPSQWPWSSFRATVGETTPPGFLTVNWVLELGGMSGGEEARRRYRAFIEAGIGQPAPLFDSLKSKLALGDDIFMVRLREQCPPEARSVEVPRVQRFAGRPPLSQLFQDVTSRADRNARTVTAVRDHGYAMKEVAEFLGRHYATVSRVMSLADGHARGEIS